jgi:hypothetical protein
MIVTIKCSVHTIASVKAMIIHFSFFVISFG